VAVTVVGMAAAGIARPRPDGTDVRQKAVAVGTGGRPKAVVVAVGTDVRHKAADNRKDRPAIARRKVARLSRVAHPKGNPGASSRAIFRRNNRSTSAGSATDAD
jgi:hypothetical protein